MKYILVNDKNVIVFISDTVEYQDNGNILIENGRLAICDYLIKKVYQLDDEQLTPEIQPNKYCYTEYDGFYKNPDYKRNYSMEERVEALEEAMNAMLGF